MRRPGGTGAVRRVRTALWQLLRAPGRDRRRVVLALVTSLVVTAAVVTPLALQAHDAGTVRTELRPGPDEPSGPAGRPDPDRPSVLGTTTVPADGERLAASAPTPTPEVGGGPGTGTAVPTTAPRPGDAPPAPPGGAPGPSPEPAAPTPGPPTAAPGATTVVPPTSAPPTTTSTVPQPSTPATTGLVWAPERHRGPEDGEPLHGAVLEGRVAIYLADRSARRVVFHLDDRSGSGPPFNVDDRWPFSLVRQPADDVPGTLDTDGLARGDHAVRAEVTFDDGRTEVRLAVFDVGG